MNKKEEIFHKYGDVKLNFSFYNKYIFTFVGQTEGGFEVIASVGGFHEDIYDFYFSNENYFTLRTLSPNKVLIKHENKEVDYWFEY